MNKTMVSIVIPTLNEADNIDPVLKSVFEATRNEPFEIEVLVVDDGSKDGTRDLVRAWSRSHPVTLIERDNERGLSGAVIAGAARARGGIVVVMDADLSHPPERIPDLVRPITAGESDMVIGSRYVPGGSTPDWPLHRRLMSRTASLLAWPLVDIQDPMSGFFAVRRDALLAAPPDADGYKIGLEIMAAGGNQLRVSEVPIRFEDRRYGESKLGPGQIITYLDRLRKLGGCSVSTSSAFRFGVVGILGMIVDLLSFQTLYWFGAGLATAHISSFLAATIFNYELNARWSFRSISIEHPEPMWHRYARFLIVAIMALLLRGAVLGALVEQAGLTPTIALLFAIAAAALVNYLGNAFFVFPRSGPAGSPITRWRVAAVGVVAYMVLLRVLYIGLPDLLMEEAYYWNYAQHPALSYLDHPPMVAWLITIGTSIFGDNEFGVRIAAVMCWFVTAAFVYLTTRDLFDKSVALRAVLLVAVLPAFALAGFLMTPDAPLTACWAGAIYFLQRALFAEKAAAWWGVGVCIGLGMLSKYTIALLGPAILLFLLLDARSRRWLLRPEPYAGALLAFTLFLPVILWNAQNGWASFAFQTVERLDNKPEFRLHLLIGALMLLVTPIGVLAAYPAILRERKVPDPDAGPQSFISARISRVGLFAVVMAAVPLSVFVLYSLRESPKLNWAGPLWLAMLPLLASDMIPRAAASASGFFDGVRRAWPAAVLTAILFYGSALHYLTLGIPGVDYPEKPMLVGWYDLASQIEELEERIEAESGHDPLVVGMDKYRISSLLAFYRNKVEAVIPDEGDGEGPLHTAGRHLFGSGSLMYERWFPKSEQVGRTIILVASEEKDLKRPTVTEHFEHMDPILPIRIHANDDVSGEFYVRIGYGYQLAAQ